MKNKGFMKMSLMAVLAALWCWNASAQLVTSNYTFTVNQAIPDADANGLALSTNISGYDTTWQITNVTVSFDITNGFNGDYYAYLAGPNGFAVLLNRVGVSNNATVFGYSDAGFNVTLDGAAANSIEYYRNASPVFNGGGQLTGTWQAEGVNINPQTNDPTAFFNAGQTATLASFNGGNPNGSWVLFFSDLSSGGQGILGTVTIGITTVPEPGTWQFIPLILGTLLVARKFVWQRKTG